MPTRTVVLNRAAQQTGTSYGRIGYRFTVEAVGTNIDSRIFRYLRRPIDPAVPGGTTDDFFDGICRPEELVSLPANNPTSDGVPMFRLATLDLMFASEEEATASWAAIRNAVTTLLYALKASDTLSVSESWTVTV